MSQPEPPSPFLPAAPAPLAEVRDPSSASDSEEANGLEAHQVAPHTNGTNGGATGGEVRPPATACARCRRRHHVSLCGSRAWTVFEPKPGVGASMCLVLHACWVWAACSWPPLYPAEVSLGTGCRLTLAEAALPPLHPSLRCGGYAALSPTDLGARLCPLSCCVRSLPPFLPALRRPLVCPPSALAGRRATATGHTRTTALWILCCSCLPAAARLCGR